MTFWTNTFLGVRVFIWIFLFISIGLFIGVLIYFFREKIKEKYLKIRWPERVIRIIIHHPGSQYFNEYWRLIPDREDFTIGNKTYLYSDPAVIKKNESYAYQDKDLLKIKVWGKEYILDKNYKIRQRWERWPEIHYIDGVPNPIDFYNIIDSNIKFTSRDLELFKENDLFQKLLTLQGEKAIMVMLIIMTFINLILGVANFAKQMGWLK